MKNRLIELNKVTVGYEKRNPILSDVDLTIYEDDFIAIVGPNGGGKTTFVKTVLSILSPFEGEIGFFENDKPVASLEVGYLPQRNQIDTAFPISVEEVVQAGVLSPSNWGWKKKTQIKQQVEDVLQRVGMTEFKDRSIGSLSGGQLQRVLLARAIVNKPRLVVLDEPNSYLDKKFESQLYPLLQELNREVTLLIVSHEAHSLLPYVNRCIKIDQGVVELSEKDLLV